MKFLEFLPLHEEIYPRPLKKSLGLSWQFWVAVAVAIAAIILASLRTAHSFFDAAVLSAQIYNTSSPLFTSALSVIEAAAAMLAIEGGIVYGAVKRAQSSGMIHPRLYFAYLGMLILISVIAGLGQSLGLILGLSNSVLVLFSWIMAVVLGVGASIVAWLSGEMLGLEMLKFDEAKHNADAAFQRANTKWLNDARKHWFEVRNAKPASSPRDQIRDYVYKTALSRGIVPPAREIGQALGLTEQYVQGELAVLKASNAQ